MLKTIHELGVGSNRRHKLHYYYVHSHIFNQNFVVGIWYLLRF